jgi:hypothetical protein
MNDVLEGAVIRPAAEAVSCELAGETVILEMASGRYYALDPIGTRVWQLLQTVSTAESLCERLVEEYEVDAATCRRDLAVLVKQMAENGLVSISDAV